MVPDSTLRVVFGAEATRMLRYARTCQLNARQRAARSLAADFVADPSSAPSGATRRAAARLAAREDAPEHAATHVMQDRALVIAGAYVALQERN